MKAWYWYIALSVSYKDTKIIKMEGELDEGLVKKLHVHARLSSADVREGNDAIIRTKIILRNGK